VVPTFHVRQSERPLAAHAVPEAATVNVALFRKSLREGQLAISRIMFGFRFG
jgi:hypothetical protein